MKKKMIITLGLSLVFALVLTACGGSGQSLAAKATEQAQFVTAEAERVDTAAGELGTYCVDNPERCLVKGDENAPVTVFEFSDYGCPHCKNFNVLGGADLIDQKYVESGQVKFIVIPYALASAANVYPYLPSANATLCAAEQGKGFEFHKGIFELQGTANVNSKKGFEGVAGQYGLSDASAFEKCVSGNDYRTDIITNITLATNLGVRSTPSFVVNGELIAGNDPDGISALIDAAIGQ